MFRINGHMVAKGIQLTVAGFRMGCVSSVVGLTHVGPLMWPPQLLRAYCGGFLNPRFMSTPHGAQPAANFDVDTVRGDSSDSPHVR